MKPHIKFYNHSVYVVIFSSAILLAIWSLPGTIALRHLLLVIGSLASISVLFSYKKYIYKIEAWPLAVVLGLYGWLLTHLLFFSNEFMLQLVELRSLWMRSFLAATIGAALGVILSNPDVFLGKARKNHFLVTVVLFLGLSGVGIFGLLRYLYVLYSTGDWWNFQTLVSFYKSKSPFVIATTFLIPLCFASANLAINNQNSKWWLPISFFGMSLSIFTCFFSNTKTGIAIIAFSFLLYTIYLLLKVRWQSSSFKLVLIFLVPILIIVFIAIEQHVINNSAWPNLIADLRIGVDINHQNFWKNRDFYPHPLNEYSNPVNLSTYERSAWFAAGVRLLSENPLGFGLIHHSFGWLASEKWLDFYRPTGNLLGATHSAWLDMTLGIGLPGMLFIIIPLITSWYRSMFQNGLWSSYISLAIPLLFFTYLINEVGEAHFIEMLLFMTAFSCGLTLKPASSKRNQYP